MAKYYTLLSRENKGEPWGAHFGDFDRETVEDERDDITQWEYKRGDTKIIVTSDEDQASIDEAIKLLNKGLKA